MQHNFDIPNQQGAEYRADVNSALQALATLSSGPVAPAAPYPHMWWMDTSSTPPVLRRRSADNTFWQVVDPGTVGYFKRNDADGDVVALSPEEVAEELDGLLPLAQLHVGKPTTAPATPITGSLLSGAMLAAGAIVEQGTNANGSYVRWESGLQVCWYTGTTPRQASQPSSGNLYYDMFTLVFPAAFAPGTTPFVVPVALDAGVGIPWATLGEQFPPTSTQFNFEAVASRSDTPYIPSYAAIGRWK